jgi:hypothetical protein
VTRCPSIRSSTSTGSVVSTRAWSVPSTDAVSSKLPMCAAGTASIQTGCQIPVARVYQMPPLPRCLPRGWKPSAGSSTSTTSSCSCVVSSAPRSKQKWV